MFISHPGGPAPTIPDRRDARSNLRCDTPNPWYDEPLEPPSVLCWLVQGLIVITVLTSQAALKRARSSCNLGSRVSALSCSRYLDTPLTAARWGTVHVCVEPSRDLASQAPCEEDHADAAAFHLGCSFACYGSVNECKSAPMPFLAEEECRVLGSPNQNPTGMWHKVLHLGYNVRIMLSHLPQPRPASIGAPPLKTAMMGSSRPPQHRVDARRGQ
jgi:hypothetical protein